MAENLEEVVKKETKVPEGVVSSSGEAEVREVEVYGPPKPADYVDAKTEAEEAFKVAEEAGRRDYVEASKMEDEVVEAKPVEDKKVEVKEEYVEAAPAKEKIEEETKKDPSELEFIVECIEKGKEFDYESAVLLFSGIGSEKIPKYKEKLDKLEKKYDLYASSLDEEGSDEVIFSLDKFFKRRQGKSSKRSLANLIKDQSKKGKKSGSGLELTTLYSLLAKRKGIGVNVLVPKNSNDPDEVKVSVDIEGKNYSEGESSEDFNLENYSSLDENGLLSSILYKRARKSKNQDAISFLDSAIAVCPNNPHPYLSRGLLNLRNVRNESDKVEGILGEVRGDAEGYINFGGDESKSFLLKSFADFSVENYDGALESIDRCLEGMSSYSSPYFHKARVEWKNRQKLRAVVDYVKGIGKSIFGKGNAFRDF